VTETAGQKRDFRPRRGRKNDRWRMIQPESCQRSEQLTTGSYCLNFERGRQIAMTRTVAPEQPK
jgi:hypothetical protein